VVRGGVAARAAGAAPESTVGQAGGMPLIDVTYDRKVGEQALRRLGKLLPDVVSEAVECPEEPWTGPAEPGDIEIRFRKKSPLDVGDLDVVIEVRTKLFEHRVQDRQRRADLIRDRLSILALGQIGVWLILSDGAWSQSLEPSAGVTGRRSNSPSYPGDLPCPTKGAAIQSHNDEDQSTSGGQQADGCHCEA
jgi:hypothetical protein